MGWVFETRSLGALLDSGVIEAVNGFPYGGHNEDGVGIPHIRPFNVATNGEISLEQIKWIPPHAGTDKPRLRRGDVVFNNTNTKELVGKCALWDLESEPAFSNHMTRIRVLELSCDPAYLSFAILHHWMTGRSEMLARAHVAQASIMGERFREIEVPWPDPAEQHAIARALALLRSSAQGHERAAKQAEELKRAAMRELFTRGLRGEPQKDTEIGLVPESWAEVSITDLGEIVTGTTPPTKERAYYDNGDIPFISPGDIEHGMPIVSTQKYITDAGLAVSRSLPAGTTCVVCIGSTIGKVGRTTAKASATNQQINAIVPSVGYDPNYLSHLLTYQSGIVRNAASPSPVPILSKGAFEKLVLFASMNPDEQTEISSILDTLDCKIDLHRKKRAVLEELFQALLHKLMTGEIRVADLDLSALEPPHTSHVAA